ncbi:hypothetical protein [Leptospira sp. GIMC2001]|uniref:hypothetical protein n=1 Tax=Leptospira sp. GIMC2001 TaxID=1513297 RepID=UPI00234950AF|nr:hypothetical protein [Leptospira sp. GIMC2001]WCL48974.1 hypothetical protein O4O04_17015 [Leptospira sp. GIMC2001]
MIDWMEKVGYMSHLELLPSKQNQPIIEQTIDKEAIRKFLSTVIQSETTHAKWLNTLSMMEHIGSRKILMSQSGINISEMVLKHAAEESRHALFFKKLANRVSKNSIDNFDSKNLLAGSSAIIYFQRLDALVWRKLSTSSIADSDIQFVAYLYVTKIIEERAVEVYEIYDDLLENHNSGISLKGILKEEEGHMNEMQEWLNRLDRDYKIVWRELLALEKKYFAKFLLALNSEVAIN